MRHALIVGLWILACSAHASSTLRVGSQVLVAGDSIERAVELLGKPSSHTHQRASSGHRGRRGGISIARPASEQWHFRRAGHYTVLTVADGRIVDIEDRRH